MRKFVAVLVMSVIVSVAMAAKKKTNLLIDLKFTPQESVDVESVALPAAVLDRSVEITVKDARKQEDPHLLGEGSDDDDRPFPIRATVDVVQFVGNAVSKIANSQSLKQTSPGDRQLEIGVARFSVNESNKALGSTYAAEVHLNYVLKDAKGKKLTEGAASGSANRYGRARSSANASEVLSDALKEAFTKVLEDDDLQSAWTSGKTSSGTRQSTAGKSGDEETTEQKLKKLDDLLEKGLITKEEHKAARAKILQGL